jgi:hypothetical protein
MYLSYFSNHPKPLLNSLPFSQALRLRRICSDEIDFNREVEYMFMCFKKRGYPDIVLQKCIEKVNSISRHDTLIPKTNLLLENLSIHHSQILSKFDIQINTKPHTSTKKLYLVIPFHNNIFKLKEILVKYIEDQAKQFTMSPDILNAFLSFELQVAFRKANSLQDWCREKSKNKNDKVPKR